jgi:hypothetical protein
MLQEIQTLQYKHLYSKPTSHDFAKQTIFHELQRSVSTHLPIIKEIEIKNQTIKFISYNIPSNRQYIVEQIVRLGIEVIYYAKNIYQIFLIKYLANFLGPNILLCIQETDIEFLETFASQEPVTIFCNGQYGFITSSTYIKLPETISSELVEPIFDFYSRYDGDKPVEKVTDDGDKPVEEVTAKNRHCGCKIKICIESRETNRIITTEITVANLHISADYKQKAAEKTLDLIMWYIYGTDVVLGDFNCYLHQNPVHIPRPNYPTFLKEYQGKTFETGEQYKPDNIDVFGYPDCVDYIIVNKNAPANMKINLTNFYNGSLSKRKYFILTNENNRKYTYTLKIKLSEEGIPVFVSEYESNEQLPINWQLVSLINDIPDLPELVSQILQSQ